MSSLSVPWRAQYRSATPTTQIHLPNRQSIIPAIPHNSTPDYHNPPRTLSTTDEILPLSTPEKAKSFAPSYTEFWPEFSSSHAPSSRRPSSPHLHKRPLPLAVIERHICHKLDTHLLPWLFLLWLLAALDRANIGNASIVGLPASLKLQGNQFNIALTIFYIPYVLVVLPSNWLMGIVGPGKWLPGLVVAWGIVDLCTGFVHSFTGLCIARFFLGLCEGGLIGGFVLYLSVWYKRKEMAMRIAVFFCASPLSGAIGGLLATGLGRIDVGGYRGWPWIFFVEGAVTVVLGAAALWKLPDGIEGAGWLTEGEKGVARERVARDYEQPMSPHLYLHRSTSELDRGNSSDTTRTSQPQQQQQQTHSASTSSPNTEKLSLCSIKMALLNPNTVLLSLANFLTITPIYSFSLFLPSIIREMGYEEVEAQLFTVPPNLLAFVTVLGVAWASDRSGVRGVFMLGGLAVAAGGYVMLLVGDRPSIWYAGTFLIGAGDYATSPVLFGWLANNLAPHYVRATGVGMMVTVANFSAFVGTFAYLSGDAPRYITGHAINLSFLLLCIVLVLIDMGYIVWENKAREAGKRDHRLAGIHINAAEGDVSEAEMERRLGHLHPRFRYTL